MPANADTGSVGWSASTAGCVAPRGGQGRSEAGMRSVAGAVAPRGEVSRGGVRSLESRNGLLHATLASEIPQNIQLFRRQQSAIHKWRVFWYFKIYNHLCEIAILENTPLLLTGSILAY